MCDCFPTWEIWVLSGLMWVDIIVWFMKLHYFNQFCHNLCECRYIFFDILIKSLPFINFPGARHFMFIAIWILESFSIELGDAGKSSKYFFHNNQIFNLLLKIPAPPSPFYMWNFYLYASLFSNINFPVRCKWMKITLNITFFPSFCWLLLFYIFLENFMAVEMTLEKSSFSSPFWPKSILDEFEN